MERRDPSRVGDLLRHHRIAAALSQEALAERAGLSVRAIGDLERGTHRVPRLETVRLLADALALSEASRAELLAAAHPQARAPGESARERSHPVARLPVPPTRLIGRQTEVAAVVQLLAEDDVRLVTLTGPGGTGKTRVALQAAAELLDDFADGVFFVPLALMTDPALVAAAVATTLGIREAAERSIAEHLQDVLAPQQLLLVLDNLEHLVVAAPFVGDLLGVAAGVKILATSRVPLRLRAEREYPVPTLSLPHRQPLPSPQQMSQYEAVRLFTDRAQSVKPDFAIDTENAPAVVEICHRLDGLPLAIELAAARVRLLPPQAMLARLEKWLPLLTGGARDAPARQRTLWDAIAWSHDLLEADDRILFRRLGVFAGGCTLEAAEAVTNPDGSLDVLSGMERLCEQSLLRQAEGLGGEPRFTMLETIREFALDHLSLHQDEAPAIQRAHTDFFADLALAAQTDLGTRVPLVIKRVRAKEDNFRVMLGHLLALGDAERALRVAGGALSEYWTVSGGNSPRPDPGLSVRYGRARTRRRPPVLGVSMASRFSPSTREIRRQGDGPGRKVWPWPGYPSIRCWPW